MSYCLVILVLLFQFKCDVDAVGKFEKGLAVVYKPSFFEELEILEVEDFGLSFLLLLNLDILAPMQGKEEGKDGELRDCTLDSVNFCFAILAMTHVGMAFC